MLAEISSGINNDFVKLNIAGTNNIRNNCQCLIRKKNILIFYLVGIRIP
jgi:hypothetical protein